MFLGWGFSIFVWHKEQNRNILHASIKSHSLWLKEQVLENTGLFCNSQCSHLLILWITCSLLFPERLKQSVKVLPKNMQQILQVTNWKRTGKKKKKQKNPANHFQVPVKQTSILKTDEAVGKICPTEWRFRPDCASPNLRCSCTLLPPALEVLTVALKVISHQM